MARGTQLGQLITMLRSESGMSVNPALGLNVEDTLKYHLRKQQERLYKDYDWPSLKGPNDTSMQAGQRYYDLPVQPESIQRVEVFWGGIWRPLKHGISGDQYNSRDSDNDQRMDPPERWQFYMDPEGAASDVDNLQFEVWPMPATNGQAIVRFWGKRALTPLVASTDKAMLDDLLIVLYASAKVVKDKRSQDMKLAEAKAHYSTVKRREKQGKMIILGGGNPDDGSKPPPGPVRVAYTLNP